MIEIVLTLLLGLIGAVCADGFAHPRPQDSTGLRRAPAIWLLCLVSLAIFGFFLAVSGNPYLALIFSIALHVLLVAASNAKYRMLGEPLLFSDFALFGAVFRHPQFYFSVLTIGQKLVGLIALAALTAIFYWLFVPSLTMAIVGSAIALSALILLMLSLRLQHIQNLAARPSLGRDAAALGLVPTLLLYWLRWREEKRAPANAQMRASTAPSPTPATSAAKEPAPWIIVVVQCESFADPVELFGDESNALAQLARSRQNAWLWGNLQVSGFGAYTMRTEYGVLFGRSEEELGFRRFDPYLTALNDTDLALPNKLGMERWRSVFVHPHDMRFYNRHLILPKAGFSELVGESLFATPAPQAGRYVTDAAVADKIIEIAHQASTPTFIYAVTMENHGPWANHGGAEIDQMIANYNRLVKAGDLMLGRLREGLASMKKPALLTFFGDHRPSIPGASEPGGPRHTPYVMVQFNADGRIASGREARLDLTPAQLHQAIVAKSRGSDFLLD